MAEVHSRRADTQGAKPAIDFEQSLVTRSLGGSSADRPKPVAALNRRPRGRDKTIFLHGGNLPRLRNRPRSNRRTRHPIRAAPPARLSIIGACLWKCASRLCFLNLHFLQLRSPCPEARAQNPHFPVAPRGEARKGPAQADRAKARHRDREENTEMADDIHADYVIVGAGSAGCVLANRLTESGEFEVGAA